MRVLGIDASLRSTGVGVVESKGSRLAALSFDVIKNPAGLPHSDCLLRLDQGIREILSRAKPDAASIEGVFFCKNVRTAVVLGEARGVVIAACAAAGVPVFEYAPRRVKQAVVGFGGAHKDQVGKMIMALLGLNAVPPPDAADALAVAICHLHNHKHVASLRAGPV